MIRSAAAGISHAEVKDLLNKPDPTILEIGANDGRDTIRFIKDFPRLQIHCFEPEPRAIRRWQSAVPKRAGVTLVETAVGAINGEIEFHASGGREEKRGPEGWDQSGSIRRPTGHLTKYATVTFPTTFKVPITRLDDWAAKAKFTRRVDLIWADVQGAEIDVIQGARRVLSNTMFFYTEYSDFELYEGQVSLKELRRLLPNFRVHTLFGGNVLFVNRRLELLAKVRGALNRMIGR